MQPVNEKSGENATIGGRLLEERRRLGFSQVVLGSHGGVSKFTQIKYEKDETSPTADYLARAGELGVDVLYVVTGRRAGPVRLEPVAPSEEVQAVLRQRGFVWEMGPQGIGEVQISLLGLMWLLNYRWEDSSDELPRWGPKLLESLADFHPTDMRGLNIQVVMLRPYGNKHYPQLLFYLDKTPPGFPFAMAPTLGLRRRYELETDPSSLPLEVPDTAVPVPVLVLSDEEMSALSAGDICRISAE